MKVLQPCSEGKMKLHIVCVCHFSSGMGIKTTFSVCLSVVCT